jgi:predicted flavoprotein YhiN
MYASPQQFISDNEHFIKSAFAQWTVDDTISFLKPMASPVRKKL